MAEVKSCNLSDNTWLDWPFFTESHRVLAKQLGDWCSVRQSVKYESVDQICRNLVSELGDAGWLRHSVPAPWGGLHNKIDVRSLAICREILSFHDGLADFAFAMQGLGSGAISLFGTDAQREQYLPGVAAGEKIAAFALSEKLAGSDVGSISTHATNCGDEYVLNGEKTWISNCGIADFYCVFARSEETPGTRGLSAFIVDADNPGLEVIERIETIAPHPLGTIQMSNCRVPTKNRISDPGAGFKIAMATLDVFRTTVGAAALGFARRALTEAVQHTSKRMLFGRPLSALQMTESSIAEMATGIDASALLVYRSAWAKDCRQDRVTREAAMAKLFATETAQSVIDRAVQLFGGSGVVRGNIVEKLYREIRALRIYEGASEIQKVIIARSVYESAAGTAH